MVYPTLGTFQEILSEIKTKGATMQEPQITGFIQVIFTPSGNVLPLELRETLVGLIFPCYPRTIGNGVAKKRRIAVPQDKLIEVLAIHRPVAAKKWRAYGFPLPGRNILFDENDVALVGGTIDPVISPPSNTADGSWVPWGEDE